MHPAQRNQIVFALIMEFLGDCCVPTGAARWTDTDGIKNSTLQIIAFRFGFDPQIICVGKLVTDHDQTLTLFDERTKVRAASRLRLRTMGATTRDARRARVA